METPVKKRQKYRKTDKNVEKPVKIRQKFPNLEKKVKNIEKLAKLSENR